MADAIAMVRALLIAEACNPEWVSVPLEGWSHGRAIAGLTSSHLVTQVRNRDALLRAGLVEGTDFTAIDSELAARPAYLLANRLRGGAGKGWTTTMALSAAAYPYFEHLVWQKFQRRLRAGEFDVVHRLTPLSPTMPSLIASRCRDARVPFVLGPLNGGVPWPAEFDSARRKEKEWLSYIRDVYKLMPGFQRTRTHASAILVGSRDTWKQMPRLFHPKCFYIAENAIDPSRFTLARTRRATPPIRAIFVGRLVPYKGADMLLEAAAPILRAGKMTLDIIGDGPMMSEIKAQIEREQLGGAVRLLGWVEHAKLQQRLIESDVMAFPSIREFGGAVVLEAMAVGVVPIVMDYGGPAELATPRTGYLVPMGSRQHIIERYRSLLGEIADHPEQIDRRSELAVRRIREHFTWEAKARRVVQVYEWVCGNRAEKPYFAMPEPDERQ